MLDTFRIHFVLSFEFDGGQHPVFGVFALRIVEHLDIFEYIGPCVFSCCICFPPNTFTFQQLKEAFNDRVIMAIAATAHAGFQVVLTDKRLPLTTCELAALT